MKRNEDNTVTLTAEEFSRANIGLSNLTLEELQTKLSCVTCLADDIDVPIKRVVAMLALLDLKPLWSCCGFNYPDQPAYKDHTFGYTYITLRASSRGFYFLTKVVQHPDWVVSCFQISLSTLDGFPTLTLSKSWLRPGMWNTPASPHASELAVTGIKYLEQILASFQDEFLEEVVLKDTNKVYRKTCFWQYPDREDWIIHKQDVLSNLNPLVIRESLEGKDSK
jgi:hypothetical protein